MNAIIKASMTSTASVIHPRRARANADGQRYAAAIPATNTATPSAIHTILLSHIHAFASISTR
jgi:hypothetical protein